MLGKNQIFAVFQQFFVVVRFKLLIIFTIWGKMGKKFDNLHNPHTIKIKPAKSNQPQLFQNLVFLTKKSTFYVIFIERKNKTHGWNRTRDLKVRVQVLYECSYSAYIYNSKDI